MKEDRYYMRVAFLFVFALGLTAGRLYQFVMTANPVEASPPPIVQLVPALPSAVPFVTSYQRLTSDDLAAATLLPDIPDGTRFAWVQVEEADVRWRNDNTFPTAGAGMLIYAGSVFKYDVSDGPIRLIRTEAGAAANIWYERGDRF